MGDSKKEEQDLGLKIRKQTELDKVVMDVMSRPLTAEELSAFGKAGKRKPAKGGTLRPYISIKTPDKEDGPKGCSVVFGISGTF